MNILKSSSKILSFCVFFGGLSLAFKLVGMTDVEEGIKVFFATCLTSGLLSGSKVFQSMVREYIQSKFGGKG